MDDEKPEKTPLELQRESIKVTVPEPVEDEQEEEKVEEKAEEKVEAKEEVIEEKAEEVEDLEEQKAAAKTTRERERLQKRIDKVTGEKKALEAENAALKKQLEAKIAEGEVPLTEADIKKEAERIAKETVLKNDFDAACNRLQKFGVKADKDFDTKIQAMAEDIGPIPSQLIGMLDDLDNGGEVLAYLANNVDDAEEIWSLSMAKQATRLAKISAKITPKPKAISKVPAPNEPVKPGGKGTEVTLNDKMSMDDWVRAREKQLAARRAMR